MRKKKEEIKIDPNKVTSDPALNEKIEGDKESKNDNVSTKDDYPYIIELYDVWGSTSKRAVRFGAKRFIEGGNVFLVNEKKGFKEPQPEDSEDYKSYKLEEVEQELKNKDKELQSVRKNKDNNSLSERDILEDIRVLKGFKRSLQLQGKGSYMIVDGDASGGKPLFMFDRRGNYKLPIFKNIDISLMYLPNEAKITEASDLIRENDEKNKKNIVNVAAGVFLVLIVIAFFGMVFFLYKVSGVPADYISTLQTLTEAVNNMALDFSQSTDLLQGINQSLDTASSVQPNVNVVN
jgi:hypothetical protein